MTRIDALPARFIAKMAIVASGCWEWNGRRNRAGYGVIEMPGPDRWRPRLAHRVAFEVLRHEIPSGLDLDHLCRNRACVNPEHLEPVTHAENIRRGLGPQILRARNQAITHCPHGHEYTPDNTYVRTRPNGYPGRMCRTCQRERERCRASR